MNPSGRSTEAGRQLGLPMMTIFSVRRGTDQYIAHALDFDLVATGTSSEDALRKLRAAVKHHVEFGYHANLAPDEIVVRAPQECWDRIKGGSVNLGEEIEIDNYPTIQTITRLAVDETERSTTAA